MKLGRWLFWIVLGLLAAAVMIAPFAVGMFAVLNDDLLLRDAYHNPVINEGYPGWKEAKLPEMSPVMLPEEWTLTADGMALTLTGADGELVAEGHVFHTSKDVYASIDQAEYRSALSAVVGFEVTEAAYGGDIPEFIYAHECDFNQLIVRGVEQAQKLFCLSLVQEGAALHLWFPTCKGEEFMLLIDRAEAIVYSFLYGRS